MRKEEAIKYLQQLYPNGGHCWLDEQRIDAINMAVKALQEKPVSNDLEEAAKNYEEDAIFYAARRISDFFKAGAKWQKTKVYEWLKEHKEHPLIGCEDPCLSGYLTDEFIEDFKKAMEE